MAETIYSPLRDKLSDYMNSAADHLACGGATSFDEYQRMVGKIEALALIERDILDLEKHYEED